MVQLIDEFVGLVAVRDLVTLAADDGVVGEGDPQDVEPLALGKPVLTRS